MRKHKREEPRPIVVVQWIEIEWGKLARSAQQATKRNSLPTAYPLPELKLKPETQIVIQRLHFDGDSNFALTAERINQYPDLSSGGLPGVDLSLEAGMLNAVPQLAFRDVQMPQTTLAADNWLRLIRNVRLVSEHVTRYRQDILNIGSFSQFSATAFLAQSPLKEYSDLRRLY